MSAEIPLLCPKCKNPMKQGFTVDMGAGDTIVGSRYVSKWAPGAPLKSFFCKTQVPPGTLPIGTFRCGACGYLESYARPDFASTGKRQFSLRSLFILITVVAVVLGIVAAVRGCDVQLGMESGASRGAAVTRSGSGPIHFVYG